MGSWSQHDEDINDATLREPVGVNLRCFLIRLEVGDQLPHKPLLCGHRERQGRRVDRTRERWKE